MLAQNYQSLSAVFGTPSMACGPCSFGNDLGRTRNNVVSMDVDQGNGGFDYVFCIWPKLMLGKLIRG